MIRWLKRRWKPVLAVFLVLGFVGINALGYFHAYALTHYAPSGERTRKPSELGAFEKVWTLITGVRVVRPVNRADPQSVGLEFDTVRFSSSDEIELEGWFVDGDSNRVAILFHGYAGSKSGLLPQIEQFYGLGFDVLAIDFRGSGGSSGDTCSLGWHESEDVAAAVRFAAERYRPAKTLLFGTSMGAVAVLDAVGNGCPDVDALIVEAPFNSMFDTVANRCATMGVPAFPCAYALMFWGGQQHGFDAFEHRPVDHVASIEQPTLMLFGADDRNVTRDNALEFQRVSKPAHRLVTLEGVGHPPFLPWVEDEWRRQVVRFVERVL